MKTIPALTLFALLITATAVHGYDFKISLFTSPPNFLREFPIGEATQADVLASLGVPDESADLSGQTMWSYEYGTGYGRRKFTFVIVDEVVVDVVYNDQGRYNGMSAKQAQAAR
jgi:hypothetical protein